jgi:uncharacterized membrane protein
MASHPAAPSAQPEIPRPQGYDEKMRVAVAVTAGVLAAAVCAFVAPWQLTVLVGWDVTAVILLAWAWAGMASADGDLTSRSVTRQDDSRADSRLLAVAAAVASLVGVALAVVKAKSTGGDLAIVLNVVAVLTVVLSWGLVHSLFTARYARLYYEEPAGGIDFKTTKDPDFRDFAYLAFTVGMTFQVSDTDIEDRLIRRSVLNHALLSYLFGAVIVASVINIVAGLVR